MESGVKSPLLPKKGVATAYDAVDTTADDAQHHSAAHLDTAPTPLPYFALFRYATAWDYFLMALGVLSSMGQGIIMPGFSIIFGGLLNRLNSHQPFDFVADLKHIALGGFATPRPGASVARPSASERDAHGRYGSG
jgi:hypothetical protein